MKKRSKKDLSYLLVSDDNYFDGLVAQINSILRNNPRSKIYLVHQLSPQNFSKIKKFIYKSEVFDETPWFHLPAKSEHITKISFGRFQADFIEEDYFFYMDTDVIQQKKFYLEEIKTIAIEFKKQPTSSNIKNIEKIELTRKFILDSGGNIEKVGDFTLFAGAIFFANKQWLINILKPKMIEVSKKYIEKNIPHLWFDMQYFHTATCLLNDKIYELPIKNAWLGLSFTKEDYPDFFRYDKIENCELLHFCGIKKPWMYDGFVNEKAKNIWLDYYLNGPITNLN